MDAVSRTCRLSGFAARQVVIQATLIAAGLLFAFGAVVCAAAFLIGLPPLDIAYDLAFDAVAPLSQSLLWLGALATGFATVASFGSWRISWMEAPATRTAFLERAWHFGLCAARLLTVHIANLLDGLSSTSNHSVLAFCTHGRPSTAAYLSGAAPRLE